MLYASMRLISSHSSPKMHLMKPLWNEENLCTMSSNLSSAGYDEGRRYICGKFGNGQEELEQSLIRKIVRKVGELTRMVVRMWKVPSACLNPLPGTQDSPAVLWTGESMSRQ